MSRPMYMLTLRVGDMTYTRKLKARLGDYDFLREEVERVFEDYAERMTKHYGGLAQMERNWNKEYAKLVGHDHHNVTTGEEYWKIVEEEEKND